MVNLIIFKIHRFVWKVKKIMTYIPLLWKDEDWDYGYLYILLDKKLEFMYYELNSSNFPFIGLDKVLKRIKIIRHSLNRLIENDYISKRHSDLLNDWWESKIETELSDGSIRMDFKEVSRHIRAKMNYYTAREAEAQALDKKIVFDGLKKYLHKMWD